MKNTENYIRKIFINNTKYPLVFSMLLYTIMYLIVCLFTLGHTLYENNTILAGDGVMQYYPMLLDFRRNLILAFENLTHGHPEINMINFNYIFGADTFSTSTNIFLPFFPVFALSVFLKEESVALLIGAAVILASYLSGISFILMCRYFNKDTIWNSVFALSYVFCGNFFYTMIWNPQFLYMALIFPVMIIEIDKVINDKTGIGFSVCVCFLSVCFFYFLVYTMPFIVVFALIRVVFLKKKNLIKNIIHYFFRGFLYTLLGIAFSAFSLMPYLYVYFNGKRNMGSDFSLVSKFIPDFSRLYSMICPHSIEEAVGLTAVVIPFVIIALIKRKKEHICLLITMMVMVSVPFFYYLLNGFQYELCRWGFVPACLTGYIASYYAPKILCLNKTERYIAVLAMILYTIAFLTKSKILIVMLILALILYNIRFIRKSLYILTKKFSGKKTGILADVLIVVFVLFTGFIAVLYMESVNTNSSCVISVLSVLIILYIKIRKENAVKIPMCFLCCSVIVSFITGFLFYNEIDSNAKKSEYDDVFSEISEKCDKENSFGRFSNIDEEANNLIYGSDMNYELNMDIYKEMYCFNLPLKYNFGSSECFYSIIDSDYLNFLVRCGMDRKSLVAKVTVGNFYGKEVMYSLFGIKHMYSVLDNQNMYGVSGKYKLDDNKMFRNIYENKYALPVGVTYSERISEKEFYEFNSAELPYAMMNAVYIDDGEKITSGRDGKEYSCSCSYDISKECVQDAGSVSYIKNKITLNENSKKDGFYYMVFSVTDQYNTLNTDNFLTNVKVNGSDSLIFSIGNENSDWQWHISADLYSLPLGYYDHSIENISFNSRFDFENLKIYYIPSSVYTDGFKKITDETLQNVKLETNSISGNIEVSEDKVLCVNLVHSDGWSAEVDGEKVPVYKANDIFLGIKLDKGYHDVKLSYRIPWLYEGIIISLISAVGTLVVILLKNVNQQISVNKKLEIDKK